MDPSSLELEYE
jgi:hypothetical protein